jgi:hypothetical protein
MYGAIGLDEIILANMLKMRDYTLRKLLEKREKSDFQAELVDIELERRGILDKLKRRKPEWFI